MKFVARYHNLWASKIKNEGIEIAMKNDWLEGLQGLDTSDIKNGLEELGEFPPNVFQFKRMCMAKREFHVPSAHECYKAAIRRDWRFHPVVKPIANACDMYWLTRVSEDKALKRFEGYYQQIVEKFGRGENLSKNKEIEHYTQSEYWAEKEVDRRVAKMKDDQEWKTLMNEAKESGNIAMFLAKRLKGSN